MKVFEARRSRVETCVVALLTAGMTMAALLILVSAEEGEWGLWLGALLGLLVSGLATVAAVRRILRPRVVIRLDDIGIYWRQWSPDPIPYSAITSYQVSAQAGTSLLALQLADPALHPPRRAGEAGMAALHRQLGFDGVVISTRGLDCSFEKLAGEFEARFAAAGAGKARRTA